MGPIDKLLATFFPSKAEEIIDNNKPYLQESLVRSESFWSAMAQEIESINAIKSMLLSDLNHHLLMGTQPQYFQKFIAPGANGILVVAPNISGAVKLWSFLLEDCASTIKQYDYRLQSNALQYFNTDIGVKRIERYYFKPYHATIELPAKQAYGNITLELVIIDEKPKYFKILASHYSGHNYVAPLPFEELMAALLAEKPNQ